MQNVLDEYGKEQHCLFEKKIRRQRFTNGTLKEYKCALFCSCMSSFIEIRLFYYSKNNVIWNLRAICWQFVNR